MKNQDPAANTDPNEYINQLVQVNSLEQLIDINQNLSTALGGGDCLRGFGDRARCEFAACGEKRCRCFCAGQFSSKNNRHIERQPKISVTAKQAQWRQAISAFHVWLPAAPRGPGVEWLQMSSRAQLHL